MSDGIESLQAWFGDGGSQPPRKRRRGRGWAIAAWIAGGLVILLGAAAVLADIGLRAAAESVASSEIQKRLPDDVEGEPTVHIHGTSVILQYLSGSFDEVEIDAPNLAVDGVPASVRVTANGVPTDLSKSIGHVTAVAELNAQAVNALVKVPGVSAPLTLGDGTIGYDGSRTVFGVPISYHVAAEPVADGERILLKPASAKITAGGAGLDLSGLVEGIVGENPIPVCVAQYLPAGVKLTGIDVTPKKATITLTADDVAISSSTLATKGSCG